MSGEAIVYKGTKKSLLTTAAVVANNAVSVASTAYDPGFSGAVGDGNGYPDAEFTLTFTFGTAPTANTTIDLYCQKTDVDGTSGHSEAVPSAALPVTYIGSFVVASVTTAQYRQIMARDVPKGAYYLLNNGTGQSISTGAVLTATPRTFGPA